MIQYKHEPQNRKKGGEQVKLFRNTVLKEKISESLRSVLPVTAVVLLALITLFPVEAEMLVTFVAGAVMLIIGMGLFNLGAETAMTPMGEYVGSRMASSKKIWIVIVVSFLVGVMITVSEPDLQVLAEQISSIQPNEILTFSVGFGVGLFLVVAMLRILFRVKLKYILLALYTAVLVMAFIIPENFIPVAFDSGGVTTGPMTVPFIMALGVGVASISANEEDDDSFGMVALCSVGPIIAVMILGIIYNGEASADTSYGVPQGNSRDLIAIFIKEIPHELFNMLKALGPIVAFFFIFRLFFKNKGEKPWKIIIGVIYTYVGLVLFLTGVNIGFMPVGYHLGEAIASSALKWIIVPFGMLIGYFIVSAEPAVYVLTKQVEEVTAGTVPRKMLSVALSVGVCLSVGIAMIRAITGISILWIIVPGYILALVLTFFVPDIFSSIAFDSGGVASGPMTATFLLPFAVGACNAVGGNPVTDAFGVVAMVAMAPLIAIQILGIVYKIRVSKTASAAESEIIEIDTAAVATLPTSDKDEIIDL